MREPGGYAGANTSRRGTVESSLLLLWLGALAAGAGEPVCRPVPVECTSAECACERSAEGLVVTEIRPRSWDDDECGEWFELYNADAAAVDLAGWSVEDPTTAEVWAFPAEDATLGAGRVAMVGSDWPDAPCSLPAGDTVDFAYGSPPWGGTFSLGLHSGGVVLRDPEGRIHDAVVWDLSWGFELGRSLELLDPSLDNSVRANWVPATAPDGWDDYPMYGTPGEVPAVGAAGEAAGPCDDGNPCTVDVCDRQAGCTHIVDASGCDDGDPCTTADRCERSDGAVRCVGGPERDCDDGDPCTADVCDPRSAEGCRYTALEVCSGTQACTTWRDCPRWPDPCGGYECSPEGHCVFRAEDYVDCDDGDPCTWDSCADGLCRGYVPDQYLDDCDDPGLWLISEGVCAPELGGVAYPIYEWLTEDGIWAPGTCYACTMLSTYCGTTACWELTGQCVILRW